MDKKSLVGFFLMFLVLIIAQYTVWKPRQVANIKEEGRLNQHGGFTDSSKINLSKNDSLSFSMNDSLTKNISNRKIYVETPLYSAVLESNGGKISEFLLKNYISKIDNNKVNMIKDKYIGALSDIVDGRIINFNVVNLDSDTLKIEVGSKDIIFDAGLYKKIYTFNADNYDFNIKYVGNYKRNNLVGWDGGLNFTEKNLKDERQAYVAISMFGTNMNVTNISNFKRKNDLSSEGVLKWAGVRTKYFGVFLIADGEKAYWKGNANEDYLVPYVYTKDYGNNEFNLKVYAGPLKQENLLKVGRELEKSIQIGWKWIRFLSRIILWILMKLYSIIPNYGIAIIFLAIIVKIVTFPLQHKSMVSMEGMKNIQPLMKEIQEKYKNDIQRQQQELMKLYRENNVSPFGGCLPLLLQMPIFFALYPVLKDSIELRGAKFVLWLNDLSVYDPYYILPILMGFFMFLQSKISVVDEKQQAMIYIMPIFMTLLFIKFSSGMVLYWMIFNILSIIHQIIYNSTLKSTVKSK